SFIRQTQVLRTWLQTKGFPLPSHVKVQQIQQNFLQARSDKLPHVRWGNVELRRYQDTLYAMSCLPNHNVKQRWDWNLPEMLLLPHLGELWVEEGEGEGLMKSIQTVSVCFRQGGEVCLLRGHH